MTFSSKPKLESELNLQSQLMTVILAFSVAIGAFSLVLIAIRFGPIARQADSWNICVNRTERFLSTLSGFSSVGSEGLTAMSVSLGNGSTPQREKGSVLQN